MRLPKPLYRYLLDENYSRILRSSNDQRYGGVDSMACCMHANATINRCVTACVYCYIWLSAETVINITLSMGGLVIR
jgi:hypothetical protein